MAAALRKAGLMERLKEPGQQLTFFAPNDAAFESLDEAVRAKVEKGNGCSRDLLNHHLLPNAICAGGHPYMTSAQRGGVGPKEDVVREVA